MDGAEKTNAVPAGTALVREERYCTTGRTSPAASPRPLSSVTGGKWLDERRHPILELATGRLHLPLGLATVLLHRADGRATALTELALHAGAGTLDLAHRPVSGGRATALEALEVDLHALADLLELALGAIATGDVRGGGLEHGVTCGERGAERDQRGTLGLVLNDLKRVQLRLGAGLGSLLRRAAASSGLAATSSGGLLSAGLALALSASLAVGAALGLGSHGGNLSLELIRFNFGRSIAANTCT